MALAAALVLVAMPGGSARAGAATRPLDATASAAPAAHARDVLVRFEPSTSAGERSAALRAAEVTPVRSLGVARMRLVHVRAGQAVADALAQLRADDDVAWAEPDRVMSVQRVPSDPLYGSLWGLAKIGAPEAWDSVTGSDDAVVAVADTGIDFAHPDLAPEAWANPGESGAGRESNGIDDDGNGFVDDVHGWDFIGWDPDAEDPHGHGTHVAGTIAAAGDDGVGVTGVAWQARLMALRICNAGGGCPTSELVSAMDYAGRMRARVFNASLGGFYSSAAVRDTVRAYPDTMFAFAAGNNGVDLDSGTDFYPCEAAATASNAVCVGATDSDDSLAWFSNHGDAVGVIAPGVDILSTLPGADYGWMNGTSMATPHVSGAAALVAAARPAASGAELASAVRRGTVIAGLEGLLDTGARLDLARALRDAPLAALDAPTIDGDARVGGELRGTPGVWDGDRLSVAYQWQAERSTGYADVAGATERYLVIPHEAAGTRVRLRVTVDDGALERSEVSAPVTVAAAPPASDADPSAPDTLITAGPVEVTDEPVFAFTSSATGATFQCRLDDQPWSACSSPQRYASAGLREGGHTFYVRASDIAGRVDPTPASRAFGVRRAAAAPTGAATPAGTTLAVLSSALLIDPASASASVGREDPGVDLRSGRMSAGLLVAREALAVSTTFRAALPRASASAARSRLVALGSSRMTLRAGESAPLAVRLSAKLRRRLAKVKRLTVRMQIVVRPVATGITHSFKRSATLRVVRSR